MAAHTLGEAWKLGWRIRVRCLLTADNPHRSFGDYPHSRNKRSTIECSTSAELDVKTLVWTRGEAFPLDQLASRLKCPRCGNRNVQVVWEMPNQPHARTAATR